MDDVEVLKAQISACTLCSEHLPLGPRPVFQFHARAKILIAGQAPGRKVHESGIPFDDASGDRLRDWLGVDKAAFYDPEIFAILPMGFCFPGTGKSGDLPPRPECVPAWREPLLQQLQQLDLTLVLGQYALAYHLGDAKSTVTDLVKAWSDHWPAQLPVPHPSPRNNLWLKRNPWFESEVLPVLRERIARILAGG